jgi:hypothetical protein
MTDTQPAAALGWEYGLHRFANGAILIYRYGVNYKLASKGCLGELVLTGTEAADVLDQIASIISEEPTDEAARVDDILNSYRHDLRDAPHGRCSSDGMLVRPNLSLL